MYFFLLYIPFELSGADDSLCCVSMGPVSYLHVFNLCNMECVLSWVISSTSMGMFSSLNFVNANWGHISINVQIIVMWSPTCPHRSQGPSCVCTLSVLERSGCDPRYLEEVSSCSCTKCLHQSFSPPPLLRKSSFRGPCGTSTGISKDWDPEAQVHQQPQALLCHLLPETAQLTQSFTWLLMKDTMPQLLNRAPIIL